MTRAESGNRTALVTGASAGIGKAFALELARDGYDVALTARRQERLEEVACLVEREHGVKAYVFADDLADPAAPARLFDEVGGRGLQIDFVVNNAGYAVSGDYLSNEWKAHADFIQVLVTAVAHLTHLFLPGMADCGFGRVVNVASVAGLVPGAQGHTLYGASKAFLVKMSQSLSLEWAHAGVHVCAVCPGFTHSEFHDVVGNRDQVSKLPKLMWQSAEEVAREGIDAVERGDAVYVNGAVNKVITTVAKHAPDRLALGLMRGASRRFRRGA